ncbi:MAG: hypothetical protein ACR2OZ_19580 [Verrucomicrobiales bacterium]
MISRQRARAYPQPSRLVKGVLFDVLCKAAALAATISIIQMFIHRRDRADWLSGDLAWGLGFLGAMAVYSLFGLLRHYHGRRTHCPLCHGTPFHEQPSQKSRDATKFPLLSYRTSTVVSLLFSGQYRCMYCGTPFRLKR